MLFSPDAKFVCATSQDAAIFIWDVSQKQMVTQIRGDGYSICDFKFLPDTSFVTASSDRTLKLWEPLQAGLTGGLSSELRMIMKGHKVLAIYKRL